MIKADLDDLMMSVIILKLREIVPVGVRIIPE